MASSRRWRAACRQFDSCAGSGGQARRRREGVRCREERGQTKELHGPKLALGNAYSVCLSAAMSCAAPCCKSKLAAMLCARRERPASTNFGSGAMRWSKADCCWPSRACNRFLVRAQLAERRGEADSKCKGVGFGPRRPAVVRFQWLRYCVLTDGCKNVDASGL